MTRELPNPGSAEVSDLLDTVLAEYNWPANSKNAARAGWEAANRWLKQERERAEAAGCNRLDTPEQVRFYENDFYVLSNFSSFQLMWRGTKFPTSEHAYHWEKFAYRSLAIADMVAGAVSAHEAYKVAERYKNRRREDWDTVKVSIMKDILREKVRQHDYVRTKLLATNDRLLVEDSWRDDFWGWGPNRNGLNMLGKLWMEVRDEVRKGTL